MRYLFSFIAGMLLFSCNNAKNETKMEEVKEDTEPLTQEVREKLQQREKVYNLLLAEQLQYDSLAEKPQKDTFDCGTRLTIDQYDEVSDYFTNVCRPELVPDDTITTLTYKIHFFIVCKRNNDNPASKQDIQTAFGILKIKYAFVHINFDLLGIDTLQADNFYDFNTVDEFMVLRKRKTNAITIFVFNSIRDNNNNVNGYARFQRGDDFVMLTGSALRNGTTLPHEVGHYFLLYHTHGKTVNGPTDELVSGDNCSCTGDDVCDTPADPNLLNTRLQNCIYLGSLSDLNGDAYKPDPTNLMCYATDCRRNFSSGQYKRIRWAALKYRDYLRLGF